MIHQRLYEIQEQTLANISREQKRLETVLTIRDILSAIDYSAEVLPVNNKEKLIRFLDSLKKKPLTGNEIKVLEEIISDKTEVN